MYALASLFFLYVWLMAPKLLDDRLLIKWIGSQVFAIDPRHFLRVSRGTSEHGT